MIVWLTRPLVELLHDRQIAEHGGSAGLSDEGLLESALARAQQLHHCAEPTPDLADLAASLAYGLAKNHAFVDGNKRSAIVACETFIEINGATLDASDVELYPVILGLAEGGLSEADLVAWLRPRLRLRRSGESVQEARPRYRAPRRSEV